MNEVTIEEPIRGDTFKAQSAAAAVGVILMWALESRGVAVPATVAGAIQVLICAVSQFVVNEFSARQKVWAPRTVSLAPHEAEAFNEWRERSTDVAAASPTYRSLTHDPTVAHSRADYPVNVTRSSHVFDMGGRTLGTLAFVFLLAMSAACATPKKLPPTLTPDQQRLATQHLMVRQVANANENIGYLLTAISEGARAAKDLHKLSESKNREIQDAGYVVANTLKRRVDALNAQIADPARPLPTAHEMRQDIAEDVETLINRIGSIVCDEQLVVPLVAPPAPDAARSALDQAAFDASAAARAIVPVHAGSLNCDGVRGVLLSTSYMIRTTLTVLSMVAPGGAQ